MERTVTTDLARRFEMNPILRPSDLRPSREGMKIECLLNPGVFNYAKKVWLLIRVAESPQQKEGFIIKSLNPVVKSEKGCGGGCGGGCNGCGH